MFGSCTALPPFIMPMPAVLNRCQRTVGLSFDNKYSSYMSIVSHVAMSTQVRPRTLSERKLRYKDRLAVDTVKSNRCPLTSSLCFFPSLAMSAWSFSLPRWCENSSLATSEVPEATSAWPKGCWSSIVPSPVMFVSFKVQIRGESWSNEMQENQISWEVIKEFQDMRDGRPSRHEAWLHAHISCCRCK